jgi:hypothetical protein
MVTGCQDGRTYQPYGQARFVPAATGVTAQQNSIGFGDITASVFAEDQAAIGNEAVQALLSGRVVLPVNAKLAAISLDELRYRSWRSLDATQRQRKAAEPMLEKLKTAKRIRDAMMIPSLMLGERLNVSNLRATAARCQADLLLVYATGSESRTRVQLFRPNETKGRYSIEAVLLDVRTGTVPFSTSASAPFEYTYTDETHYDVAVAAEETAVGHALDEIATKLVRFLDEAP